MGNDGYEGRRVGVRVQFLRGEMLIVGAGNLYRLFLDECMEVGNEI